MSKIKAIAPINFGIVEALRTKSKSVTIENISDSTQAVEIASNKAEFSVDKSDVVIVANFPPNATIYFASNKRVYDTDGKYYTTDQGYGIFGTTDADSNLTLVSCMKLLYDLIVANLYLISEFEDGVAYYATPEGEITTDITGIYLGVGNSDGDIDLDIIEYAVEITSPLDSADIALDVPFTFEATTNVQDGRTLHVVAYSAEVPSGVALGVFEISGGAITGSVTVSESDGFTTGAVQLLAWYSPVVSTIDTVDVTAVEATITNVTSTPASPTEATNFELSGESTYLVGEELTLQYSTDDSTWLPLGVATVQPDGTWSKDDCQIATAGTYYLRAVYDTDKVESASISVTVESGIEYPYAMRDNSNVMRYSKTLDLSTDIITGFTMSASVKAGEFVYDGEYVYSLTIVSANSVTITKLNMTTGATIDSYNFDPNVDITNKLEFYSRNSKIYLFWQDGIDVKFKILSRALAVLTDGMLEAQTGVTITLKQIGRGIIDVGSNNIFVAVYVGIGNPMGYTPGFMAYNMYGFDGTYIKGVRETGCSTTSQADYVNVMCFQDGKVGLYDRAPTNDKKYIYDANGNDIGTNFSFSSIILDPTNSMYRYSFMVSRFGVNSITEYGSTGSLGSNGTYAYGRRGVVKAF